ncbi:MAG: peptidoglycan editing factor PgeF [Gammaproteobacteria bacterium]|jgi:hypothetical protein
MFDREGTKSTFLVPDWQVPDNIVAHTTTRYRGFSRGDFGGLNLATHVGDEAADVASNRDLLVRELDAAVSLQWLDQVHGTDVVQARRDSQARRADAVITTERNLACCVLTADCLPVFFASQQGDAVGVAHAGWRGLAAGILENTLSAFPAPPAETAVWLGPAIGPCHFEVGGEVREAFLGAASGALRAALHECFQAVPGQDKYLANLYGLATARLQQQGVQAISGGGFCTYCDADQFYSFRRRARTGRMASLIYLKD